MALLFDSLWLDLLFIVISFVVFYYYRLKKQYRYFEIRGIPYHKFSFKSFDVLFQKRALREFHKDIYDEFYDAPYSGIFQFSTPSLFIRDPALIQAILIKDFNHFEDHGIPVDEENNPLDAHLFGLSGDKWRTLRHKLTPVFTSGKLKWMYGVIDACCDRLIDLLESEVNNSSEPDFQVRDLFARFSTDVIASCAFGIDGESIKDPDSQFRVMSRKVFGPGKLQMLRATVQFIFPNLAKKLKLKSQPQDVSDFFISLTKQGLEERRKSPQRRTDFLQLLLELKEKGSVDYDTKDQNDPDDSAQMEPVPGEKLVLTDELLAAQVFVFFLAAFENIAIVVTYASYFLSKHPDIQEQLRKELKAIPVLDYNAVNGNQLLDSVVKETLRLIPPAEALIRKCNKNYPIGDGNEIEAGTIINIPVSSLQVDPKYWERPNEFWPDRFRDGWNPVPGTYLPFGDGPRVCIAMRFAMLEIKLALAKVIMNFKLSPSPKTQEPLKYKPGFFVDVVGGIWMRLQKI